LYLATKAFRGLLSLDEEIHRLSPGRSDARPDLRDLWLENELQAGLANGSGRYCPDFPTGDGPV